MEKIYQRYSAFFFISFFTLMSVLPVYKGYSHIYTGYQQMQDTVSPQQVQKSFDLHGRNLPHSRLFFNKTDIRRLQYLLDQKDTIILIGYQQLLANAEKSLQQPLLHYGLDAANLRIPSIHAFASQVPSLVMLYQLTGDTTYARRCWDQLELFIDYPDWGASRHFLDTGIGAFDFALAYDGLYDYLNDHQKALLKKAVLKNVLLPAKVQMEQHTAWWNRGTNNWNGICNGGLIMAALAMYEDDPGLMSKIISLAANGLPHYIHAFEPDGQSEEGLMYWGYGLMYTTLAFESMYNLLGTAFGIDDKPGFKKTGWFPLFVSGPVTSLSVGDDPVKKSRSGSFFWFAKRNKDSALAKMQYDLCLENHTVSWADMLFYQPSLVSAHSNLTAYPTDNYIHGIELMSLRENWNKDALFISMHGGSNNANHGHLDAGSFDIQAFGQVWAYGDLGSDMYTFPGYFDKTFPAYYDQPTAITAPGRWHFYRLRAEGKNCMVINPGIRPDQDPLAAARFLHYGKKGETSYYITDLTDCYKRDVQSYQRGIKMDRVFQIMTVQDDIIPDTTCVIWWGMHTKAEITITEDKRTAILKSGGQILVAKIVSPEDANFQVLPASYLPEESFPLTRQSENIGFKKLAIQYATSGKTTFRVDFSKEKEIFNGQKNLLIPLKDW